MVLPLNGPHAAAAAAAAVAAESEDELPPLAPQSPYQTRFEELQGPWEVRHSLYKHIKFSSAAYRTVTQTRSQELQRPLEVRQSVPSTAHWILNA